jgi:glycosidase
MIRTRSIRHLVRSALLLILLFTAANAFAVLADAGHRPFNAHVPNANGVGEPRRQFREPYVEISNNPASPTTITVYTVVKRTNNPFGTANQTGGTLFYKGANDGAWQSVALGFHANEGDFQYWKASFSSGFFDANEVIQYYFQLNFDSGAENTFIYAGQGFGDLASQTTNSQATAASNAFTIRNRPGWIFHAGNRVTSGNDMQFWAKVGYIGDMNDPNTRWATNGAIYYTTNGSEPTPGTSPGTASGSTQVAAFAYSHPESNNMGDRSIAGTPMWWVATAPNLLQGLPLGANMKYKIGFWHSSNGEQKFAEHNAGTNNTTFSFTHGVVGEPVLTVNGLNANYTTSKLYVNEMAAQSVPLNITFAPGENNVTEVEVFTNLNRRDRAERDANGDGIEDGIVPIDGNTIASGSDAHYFKAHVMTPSGTAGVYALTLQAHKAGAYRLTARWKVSGDTAWRWYTNSAANRRDHAITVAPVDARNINLYEINTLNIEASGDQFHQRSTFEDLYDAPNAQHNFPGGGSKWNLDYLKNLGANWLWFQPIHPPGVAGRENDPSTGAAYEPGSPYAVKNFFEVSQVMSVHNSRAGAMAAFQGFVAAADQKGVGVMLDAPFNHTAHDVELSQLGVQLFSPTAQPTDEIRQKEARFFSRAGAYNLRAFDANSTAPAPDREDFGKWNDTKDVFFGVYAALVHSGQNGNYNNEGDWFDYGSFAGSDGAVTRNVWKYFAEYTLFWLDKTGVPAGADLQTQTARGIDGLRADFGQGLPPQLWEYITNKTRTRKWNFVFMSESLDGGAVTYRSNRHFDILNENIVFPLKDASSASDFRNIFENRRSSYGLGLVLVNNTSHDEENYVDPWQALIRYAVAGTVDGVPMIFPGQELGISRTFGYDRYELNFGKTIAHFKRYNSMMPAWNDAEFGNDQLYPVFSGIGLGRIFSPALRSSNRFFLNQVGGAVQPQIFSVAKYETRNASPATSDVVFAFVNIDRNNNVQGNFNLNQDVDGSGGNDYGIKSDRTYDFKNIAAYLGSDANRRSVFLNRKTGAQLLNEGLFVALNKVPTMSTSGNPNDPAWNQRPYEAQYLKLYDVTAPTTTAGAPATPNAYSYAIGNTVTISWTAAPPDGDGQAPVYRMTGSDGSVYETVGTSVTVTANNVGQTITYTVQTVNPNDRTITGPVSGGTSVTFLTAGADHDGDGMTNANEDIAGTNPMSATSVFRVQAMERSGPSAVTLTWSSVPGEHYFVDVASSPGGTYSPIERVEAAANAATTSYTAPAPTDGSARFYRVRVGQ